MADPKPYQSGASSISFREWRTVSGGPALDQFDLLGAMVNWVEKGIAPTSVLATGKAFPGRSRPLCPYPKHAQYKGQGNAEDAQNFECR